MNQHFSFEFEDVGTPTVKKVSEALDAGRGAVVVGRAGCGKTHAVASAVNGALWTTVSDSAFAIPRLIADLCVQAGASDTALQAYTEAGPAAACLKLDSILGKRVVVCDGAEHLWSVHAVNSFEEPDARALWVDEVRTFREWLVARVATTPTIVVGRYVEAEKRTLHISPPRWPVKLAPSESGHLDWKSVADRVAENPAATMIAASALRLAGVGSLRAWLDDTEGDEPRDATRRLGDIIREHASRDLARVLAVIAAAGEVSADTLSALSRDDDELDFGVGVARELRLLEERGGTVRVVPFLRDIEAIHDLDDVGGRSALKHASRSLLSAVNDRSSLDPRSARAVLDAHRLQLAIGDFDGALTTARLHLGGLIGYARASSLAAFESDEFDQARRAYASIRGLIDAHPSLANDRVKSYVSEYHGYNGYRAGTVGLDQVARDYEDAISKWRENALWHTRRIALAAERGETAHAVAMVEEAYESVPDHPCRDGFLRVRAAHFAHHGGATQFALRLLDEYSPPPSLGDVDPLSRQYLVRLYQRWQAPGIEIARIELEEGRVVVFQGPVRVRIEGADPWVAVTDYPPARATGFGPFTALRALGRVIADETLRLVRHPSGRLERHEVARKGLYLGAVDLRASEIGLGFHTTRWLVGDIDGDRFIPDHDDLGAIVIEPHLLPTSSEGKFFARVPVDRGGYPSGSVQRLVAAGSGRSVEELMRALREIVAEDDDAA